jgi:hypothetical protein
MGLPQIHIEGVFDLMAMPKVDTLRLSHANSNIDKGGRHKFIEGLSDKKYITRRPLFNFISQNKYRPNGVAMWPEMAQKCSTC